MQGAISDATVDIDLQEASPAASVVEYVDLSNGEIRSEIVSPHMSFWTFGFGHHNDNAATRRIIVLVLYSYAVKLLTYFLFSNLNAAFINSQVSNLLIDPPSVWTFTSTNQIEHVA